MLSTVRKWLEKGESHYDSSKQSLKDRYNLRKPIAIQSYFGYGGYQNGKARFWLRGRVLEDQDITPLGDEPNVLQNLLNQYKRYESDELPNEAVLVELPTPSSKTPANKAPGSNKAGDDKAADEKKGPTSWSVTTDAEGYFELRVNDLPKSALQPNTSSWVTVNLSLPKRNAKELAATSFTGQIFIVQEACEYAIVSDIDDTIVKTSATKIFKHISTVLLNSAASREPFTGVAELYQALQHGPDGKGHNPVFYVSSSPWNIFGLFADFMRHHNIPVGPIRLKDFGLTKDRFLKSGHANYKYELVQNYLDDYPELNFILVGDSGQADAEVYAKVVEKNPDRILAVYVRHVTDKTPELVEKAKQKITANAIPFLLMEDSSDAARHAEDNGWLSLQQRQKVETVVTR